MSTSSAEWAWARRAGRRPTWAGWSGLALLLMGCGADELQSVDVLQPPETGGFDPSRGGGDGGYYGTDGPGGGESGGDETGPSQCDDDNKRCPAVFSLADQGYSAVEVFGDFAPGAWDSGVPLTLSGGTWAVTVPVPFAQPVQYKFWVDDTDWRLDPENPATIDDGQGGQNSLLAELTCRNWTCEPDVIGTFDWRDAVIYFVFVDRFFNGDPSNDGPIGVPAASDWQGGDWAGVTQKIDEGYFNDLGVNTLWISVPLDNTNASGVGTDGRDYSAYHAYWPSRMDQTEEHFGTLTELQQLIEHAHAHDLRVLFDYAMNHVHQDSPVYAEHPGWFWPNDNGNGGDCVCGFGCGWEGADATRCWFTSYLPDFDFTNPEARAFSVGNALSWIVDTNVDGLRLDAVKHIEDQWLLDLRAQVTDEIEQVTGEHFYLVGETYTGNQGAIARYVNPEMLDGQFDFPLRMELARTVLMRQGAMSDLSAFMDGNDSFYGAGIMSTFIGNHDIPRAIHLAEDTPLWSNQWADGKDRAWMDQPALPTGPNAFERMANAFSIIMTTKGAPLVYYGDEYGLAGAGDPDNRRFMQWADYTAEQSQLFAHLQKLLTIRAEHPATRKGVRTTLSSNADTMAYMVQYANDTLWVAVNRSDAAQMVGGLPDETLVDELGGGRVSGPAVLVSPRSSLILTRP